MPDPLVVRDQSFDLMPPRWATWSGCVNKGNEPSALGYRCNQASLNRFAARYRVARAFKGVELVGYADATASGYSGLFRLFLAWSAFEQYLKAIPMRQPDCGSLIAPHVPAALVSEIRTLDVGNRFFNLILAKANAEHTAELVKYRDGSAFNPSYLASAIRHIFAHGMLTPNAKGADPASVANICDLLSKCHLTAAGEDFRARVVAFVNAHQ